MKRTFSPFHDTRISDFAPLNESLAAAMERVGKYIANLEDARTRGHGLTLLGPSGVGKTMLASTVLNEAEQRGYRIEAIELATYVSLRKDQFSLAQLMKVDGDDEIVDQYVAKRRHIRSIQGVLKHSADWVLFDDVGREFPSDSGWNQMDFFDTVRSRWNRGLPSILTTNHSMAELRDRYTEGLTSLLRESSEIILLDGADYRCRTDT